MFVGDAGVVKIEMSWKNFQLTQFENDKKSDQNHSFSVFYSLL